MPDMYSTLSHKISTVYSFSGIGIEVYNIMQLYE